MQIKNINCQYFKQMKHNNCSNKNIKRNLFGRFCTKCWGNSCDLVQPYPRPPMPPPPRKITSTLG